MMFQFDNEDQSEINCNWSIAVHSSNQILQ